MGTSPHFFPAAPVIILIDRKKRRVTLKERNRMLLILALSAVVLTGFCQEATAAQKTVELKVMDCG